jgi:Fe-S cluster biogenesis protein NfuA
MSSLEKQKLTDAVDAALNEIRPHLAVDGGNIEIVEVTDDFVVKVKWLGNCETCSMSAMTMRAGVEQTIKTKVPQIKEIIAVNGVGV